MWINTELPKKNCRDIISWKSHERKKHPLTSKLKHGDKNRQQKGFVKANPQ